MVPMRRAVQTARAVIGSPWTRVSGTVVGLAILAHSINVPQAVASLAHADPLWIAAALGLTMLAVAASVVEWGVLLRTANAPAGAGPGVAAQLAPPELHVSAGRVLHADASRRRRR